MTTFMSCSDEAAAKGTHYIEEAARVYLMRDLDGADKWVIDPATVDGYQLESDYDNGPQNIECTCERPADCTATVKRMEAIDLPTADELLHLLAHALGCTVTKGL